MPTWRAAQRMSLHGTKRTSGNVCYLVANGGKADIAGEALSVAIDPQQTLGESNGHDDHRYKSRRRELLNHVRLFFPNVSPAEAIPPLICLDCSVATPN